MPRRKGASWDDVANSLQRTWGAGMGGTAIVARVRFVQPAVPPSRHHPNLDMVFLDEGVDRYLRINPGLCLPGRAKQGDRVVFLERVDLAEGVNRTFPPPRTPLLITEWPGGPLASAPTEAQEGDSRVLRPRSTRGTGALRTPPELPRRRPGGRHTAKPARHKP